MVIELIGMAAEAQWLCREASSTRAGQTITACGVGQSRNLDEARKRSRESAIEEFKRVCQLSVDCSDYDYTISPKRTDCETKNELHICYRALDFEITNHKKKSVSLNLTDLEREFARKNEEIQQIQERIQKINQIKESEQQVLLKNKELAELEATLNQKEAEALKLEDLNSKETIELGGYRYLHQLFQNSLKISVKFWDAKLSSENENDTLIDFSYERRPFSWLGMQIYLGVGSGNIKDQKKEEDTQWGTPNTTKHFNGDMGFTDVGFAALIYPGWRGMYFKIDSGYISGSRKFYDATYNNLGSGVVRAGKEDVSSSYLGAHLGFDTRDDKKGWGVFFELGGRKLTDRGNLGFVGGVGINYGF